MISGVVAIFAMTLLLGFRITIHHSFHLSVFERTIPLQRVIRSLADSRSRRSSTGVVTNILPRVEGYRMRRNLIERVCLV